MDWYLDYYKDYKPNADAIMVFGKRMKEAFSRLEGFDKDKIFVTR